MYCPRSRPMRQRGAALVLALLVFAICSVLIIAMTRDFNRIYQQGSNTFVMAQSKAYLLGAEGLATLALLADDDADRKAELNRDDLGEIWAREAQPYPLEEGGWLVGELEDLQGRFTFANQAFCRLLGKTQSEILDTTDFDHYPPELARKYRQDASTLHMAHTDRELISSMYLLFVEEKR